MKLEYEEKPELRFPYWLTYRPNEVKDSFFFIDINQWTVDQFGGIGETWGWQMEGPRHRSFSDGGPILGWYSWRFKDKESAMLFKLKWG